MLIADVDEPGNHISSLEMRAMTDADRDMFRGRLLCPDARCHASAFYVRPSRAGGPGHFASREHTTECELRTTEDNDLTEGQLRDERALLSDGDLVVLRFDRQNHWSHVREQSGPESTRAVGASRTRALGEAVVHAQATMGLRRLLQHLVRGFGLGVPGPVLQLSDGTRGPAAQVIDAAGDLDGVVPAGRRLIWGRVASTNLTGNRLWMNSGPYGTRMPSLQLDAANAEILARRENVARVSDLRRHHFICEATARTKSNGAALVPVPDLALLALHPEV